MYYAGWSKELLADVDDDEEKKTGTREKLLIHQVFVFDHHSMHFLLTCPFYFMETHQKPEKTHHREEGRTE